MLLCIKADNIIGAWKQSLISIFKNGVPAPKDKLIRNSILVIEISDISKDEKKSFSKDFPISFKDINFINDYLVFGINKEKVIHDWTKLYRERLVNKKYDQIEEIINYLKQKPYGKKAQASVWDQSKDLYGKIGPCLQVLWFQVVDNKLDLHVHMRASDAYGKLLMNINEFAALQRYVSEKLEIKSGKYYQFVDTCHINEKDFKNVSMLVKKWQKI